MALQRFGVGDTIRGDNRVLAAHEGNFGVVYICRQDLPGGKPLYKAIKTFRDSGSPACKRLFERELTYWSGLPPHPNVVQARDADTVNQLLILEYVHGPTLHDLAFRSPVHPGRFIQWAREIASGLEFLHENEFVHRDLKPSNILVDVRRDLTAKITDLGIGKRLDPSDAEHTIIGSHRYMAPEVHGARTDYRSDIFTFGATLYFLLSGRNAIRATTRRTLDIRPLEEFGLGVPRKTTQLVAKCLEREPDRRFETVGELRSALDELEMWPTDRMPLERCEKHRYYFYHSPSSMAACPFCRFEARAKRREP